MNALAENTVETAPDSDDEDEEENGMDGSDTASVASEAGSSASKKKKKKKKKKGKAAGGGDESLPNTAETTTSTTGISPKESDRRLSLAIELIHKGDDMWLDLASSSIQQARVQKLLDALKTNDSVTSINLSGNLLDDAACSLLAVGLGMKGANGLLDLDLRDNPLITQVGLNVLEGLRKMRKKLLIKTGSTKTPVAQDPPEAQSSSSSSSSTGGSRLNTPKGKLFKKFFQTGDDDEDAMERQESVMDDRGIKPHELWAGIRGSRRDLAIVQLTAKLGILKALLERETGSINSPNSNPLDGTKPHLKECAHHYEELRACLSAEPKRHTMQFSSRPQPSVGTHRVAVAEVLIQLLSSGNLVLDSNVAKSKLVPLVLHLALTHPLCSNLHAKTLKVMASCLASPCSLELLAPLMATKAPVREGLKGIESHGGWWCDLRDPTLLLTPPTTEGLGEVLSLTSNQGGQDGTDCPPLSVVLAAAGMAMVGKVSGSRSPAAGFVLRLCRMLKEDASKQPSSESGSTPQDSGSRTAGGEALSTSAGSNNNNNNGGKGGKNAASASASSKQPTIESVAKALGSCEAWQSFTSDPDPWGEDGSQASTLSPLSQLIKEQDDDLCGPKPVRPPPPPPGDAMVDDAGMGELAEMAGGGLMSGRDILALLQGMGRL